MNTKQKCSLFPWDHSAHCHLLFREVRNSAKKQSKGGGSGQCGGQLSSGFQRRYSFCPRAQGPLSLMGKQFLTVQRHVDIGGNWIAALREWLV